MDSPQSVRIHCFTCLYNEQGMGTGIIPSLNPILQMIEIQAQRGSRPMTLCHTTLCQQGPGFATQTGTRHEQGQGKITTPDSQQGPHTGWCCWEPAVHTSTRKKAILLAAGSPKWQSYKKKLSQYKKCQVHSLSQLPHHPWKDGRVSNQEGRGGGALVFFPRRWFLEGPALRHAEPSLSRL